MNNVANIRNYFKLLAENNAEINAQEFPNRFFRSKKEAIHRMSSIGDLFMYIDNISPKIQHDSNSQQLGVLTVSVGIFCRAEMGDFSQDARNKAYDIFSEIIAMMLEDRQKYLEQGIDFFDTNSINGKEEDFGDNYQGYVYSFIFYTDIQTKPNADKWLLQ
jgi:hypothetical protein